MAISLQKGQKIEVTDEGSGLTKLMVGLGWDTKKYDGGFDFDLDASAFLLTEGGLVTTEGDFVFYGNLEHSSGAVKSMGDNRTGSGEGDDEQIFVDLSKVPRTIQKIAFTVTIYEADARKQNFGQVGHSYIRVVDEEKNIELLRFDLGEDYSVETAVVVGELYRTKGKWKFNAIGSGFKGGLAALCANYGISVK